MELRNLTIKNFHKGLTEKEFSAFEAVRELFSAIEEKNPEIEAYLSLFKDEALEQANEVDIKIAQGDEVGYLAGVPLAIKDNILIKGTRTTAASKILENYTAAYDAGVVEKLKEEKAVFLGKANMDEFAMGSSTENSAFKTTKNPHDISRVPGGSSGGSAAAVAADMAVAALGSDTGGSIRQPASFCGVVGMKPTYGAVSRFGLMAMASSLDQIGPFAKTVEDAEILFKAIAGKDGRDSTSVSRDYSESFLKPDFEKTKKLTIGLPREYFIDGMDAQTRKAIDGAVEVFRKNGVSVKEISLPHTKYALSCYYIIMTAEVSSNLARFDGIRYSRLKELENNTGALKDIYFAQKGRGFGLEPQRRIILGTFVLSSGYYDAYYAKAQKVRRLIKDDFEKAFKEVDVIFTPVSPTPAFKIGEKTSDPLQMYLSDIFTIPLNLAGLPGISIPVKKYKIGSGELPVGFQLIGRPFCEQDIFGLGRYYEYIHSDI